jgi:hypothetical protein
LEPSEKAGSARAVETIIAMPQCAIAHFGSIVATCSMPPRLRISHVMEERDGVGRLSFFGTEMESRPFPSDVACSSGWSAWHAGRSQADDRADRGPVCVSVFIFGVSNKITTLRDRRMTVMYETSG